MPKGSTILTSNNGYTGTMRLLEQLIANGEYQVKFVDIANNELMVN